MPSSASPQEYTSPSEDRARQCFPPEFTATFLMNTCWMDSSRVGVDTDSALSLYETCKVRTIKAGTLERLVEYMLKAFRGKDSSYVTIFLCTYRSFASTRQVLDLLLNRCVPI